MATLLLLARTALLAQLASTVALVLLVLVVTQRGGDAAAATTAALSFVAPMLFAFVLNGLFYAELGAPAALALAGSPLAAGLALVVAERHGTRAKGAVAVVGVVVLLTPFVVRAALAYTADDRGAYEYGE
jgi:hypothetical protein